MLSWLKLNSDFVQRRLKVFQCWKTDMNSEVRGVTIAKHFTDASSRYDSLNISKLAVMHVYPVEY